MESTESHGINGITRNHTESLESHGITGITWNHMESRGITWNQWNHTESHGITWNHMEWETDEMHVYASYHAEFNIFHLLEAANQLSTVVCE